MHNRYLYCPACAKRVSAQSGLMGCPASRAGEEHALIPMGPAVRVAPEVLVDGLQPFFRSCAAFAHGFAFASILKPDAYEQLLGDLEAALERWEGQPPQVTPLVRAGALAEAVGHGGPLWVKDETGFITGSHKARHLLATLLYLEGMRRLSGSAERAALAIYSCGNAALAAAAVARAGGYSLRAFVPEGVDPVVEAMLRERGARVAKRGRRPGDPPGDPCYHAFRAALRQGHVAFSCSGSDNWSNIEGGETLGLEMILQLRGQGAVCDHLVVQVGGGALARCLVRALAKMRRGGVLSVLPRVHACQAQGGFPFVRAYLLALRELSALFDLPFDLEWPKNAAPLERIRLLQHFESGMSGQISRVAEQVRTLFHTPLVQAWVGSLPMRRGAFMRPWDGPLPSSLADGILDDETYDWYELLLGMLESGGQAVIATETDIVQAKRLADRATGMHVSATGAAGLAGLLVLQRRGCIAKNDSVGLLFTGVDRSTTRWPGPGQRC